MALHDAPGMTTLGEWVCEKLDVCCTGDLGHQFIFVTGSTFAIPVSALYAKITHRRRLSGARHIWSQGLAHLSIIYSKD